MREPIIKIKFHESLAFRVLDPSADAPRYGQNVMRMESIVTMI